MKALRIITSHYPLEKISEDKTFYLCKMCQFFDVCHGGMMADRNCRTCTHSTPVNEGNWMCSESTLTMFGPPSCCDDYQIIPELDGMPF
jgi:hypothetical protein